MKKLTLCLKISGLGAAVSFGLHLFALTFAMPALASIGLIAALLCLSVFALLVVIWLILRMLQLLYPESK